MRCARIFSWSIPALALLLWFGATLFYLGDTGRYSDDHAAHLINPTSGAIDWTRHPWQRWDYFWRPIHLAHCTFVNTLSWKRPWFGHVELALIHAAVGLALRGLLIRLGVRSTIAGSAALLFVLCPLIAEAALWTSASCNAISSLLLLLTLELVRRHATEPYARTRIALIAAFGFIIPCWYEPAAAGLAAVPLVYLAACPDSEPWRDRLRRIGPTTLLCALGCGLYIALLILTAPARARGSLPTLVAPGELPSRITALGRMASELAFGARGQDILCGSFAQGIQALRSSRGVFWLFGVACLAILVIVTSAERNHHAKPETPPRRPKPGAILLIGVTISTASCLPVLASDAPSIDLRTLYVPLLGLTFAFAGLANGIAEKLDHRRAPTRALLSIGAHLITLVAACFGAIGMIGFQTQFRTIDRHDQLIVSQLRAAIPNPAPETTFLPLIISCRGAATGYPLYDSSLHSGLQLPSHATTMLRFAFGRTDVSCVGLTFRLAGRIPISDLGADGFRINRTRGGALAPVRVPWEKTIPFVVDASGTVSLVGQVKVIDRAGVSYQIRPTQVRPLLPIPSGPIIELIENPDGRTRVHIVDNSTLPVPSR